MEVNSIPEAVKNHDLLRAIQTPLTTVTLWMTL